MDRLHNDALFKGFYSSFLLKEPNKMKQQQELLLMCGNLMCNTILYTSSACKDYTRVNEKNIGVYSFLSIEQCKQSKITDTVCELLVVTFCKLLYAI